MSLRSVCIELRENLLCANVFLQFENNLTESESLKISINPDELTLKEKDNDNKITLKISDYFSLDTETLTNLAVGKHNASFRFNINSIKEIGTSKEGPTSLLSEPLFEIGKQGIFICGICKRAIMGTDTFVRTREFPSGAVDSSEFFCHAATEFQDILVPRICDIYYGLDFVVVNYDLIESTTKVKCGHIYCQRCLQHLGETLFNGKAVKLWADVLKLYRKDQEEVFSEILTKLTIPRLIQKIVDDCTDVNDPIHSMNFAKILISTSLSNRTTRYLMIHILEKKLKILRNKTPFIHNNSNNNNNDQEMQLTECRAFKMLYKFLEEHTIQNHDLENKEKRLPAILQFWQQDISIQTLEVSPITYNTLLQELEDNSMVIPELYRFNKDGFILSYIYYDN